MTAFENSAKICTGLNDRLCKLGLKDVVDLSPADLQEGKSSQNLLKWLNAMLRELSKLNSKVKFTRNCASTDQVMDALKDDPPYFDKGTKNLKYKLLSHLCSQIQTEWLIRHNESATAMDVEGSDDQDSSTTFQLDKIGKILNTRVSAENVGVVAAADAVTARLQEIRSSQPDLLDTDLPRILAALPELNPQQKAKLAAVEEMLFKDFELRRQMLVKRMEVTVESFLWSQKAEASAGSIRAAVAAKQRHLTQAPARYEVRHAVEANVTLLHEQSKRVTADPNQYASSSGAAGALNSTVGTKSITKQILVGEVPDRGGRADEVRTKQLKEDIRRSFGGHGGGGGGGFRSHGGGGGGAKEGKKGAVPNAAPVATTVPTPAAASTAAAGGKGGNGGGGQQQQGGGGNKRKGAVSDSADQAKVPARDGGILERAAAGGAAGGAGQPGKAGSTGGNPNAKGPAVSGGREAGGGGGGGGKAQGAGAKGGSGGGVGGASATPATAKVTTIVGASSGSGSGRVVSVSVQESPPAPAPSASGQGPANACAGGLPPPPKQNKNRNRNNK